VLKEDLSFPSSSPFSNRPREPMKDTFRGKPVHAKKLREK